MKNTIYQLLIIMLSFQLQAQQGQKILIPAGSFNMGCSIADKDCASDEGKAGGISVFVPAFFIDKNEVTVAQYNKCIKAGKCKAPTSAKITEYCNIAVAGRNKHPMNCVDWLDANNYCLWVGARLPFEAEWEKAARAGSTQRYPWGHDINCNFAILDDGETRGSAGDELDGCGEDRTWAIASRTENAFGLFDMHGNAGEWTANWYAPNAISLLYANGDIKGPESSPKRVVRGGSWDESKLNLRSSFRNVKSPVSGRYAYGSIGFRCAADAPRQ
ncbi:MAG TPA: formylglycine-generating enzyme family protein [Oceanospirillales bacterium]|nr:formylglycine-generating enzyme family protein [Oceanospirillales bacterium]